MNLSLESIWETSDVILQATVVGQELNVGTVSLDLTSSPGVGVLLSPQRCETPVLGDNDLLSAGELVLGSSESFDGGSTVRVTGSDGQDDLANVDTSDGTVGLSPGTTHTSLQSIGTGTGQHLIDTDDVEWVASDTHVETVLSSNLDEILVGANTGGFKSLGAQLFVLIGNEMDAERELVDTGTLSSKIEDTDLRIWDTTVESGLWVWLVLAVTVTTSWTTTHFDGLLKFPVLQRCTGGIEG